MVTKNYFSTHLWSGVIAMVAIMLLSLIPARVYAAVTAPTDVKVTTLAPTSVTLGWEWTTTATLDRHDIDIRVSTIALTSSVYPTATTETEGVVLSQTVENLEEPSFLIAPLAEGTYYYVYMRENATHDNQGTSSWVTLTFATPCSATSQLPISGNFDASASQLPACWSSLGTAPTFSSSIHHGDAGNSVKLDGSVASSYLYSPILSSSSNAYYLTAYIYGAAGATYRVGIASTEDWLNAEILLEGTIKTANTWTFIDAVVPAELRAGIEDGMEFLWVIYSAEGDNSSFYVDDMEIGLLPACITPSALTIGEVAENSVQLSWTERGTATAWVVEYSDGTETYQATANSNPFILESLTSNTAYTVRVQANCGSESSNWTEVENFKTLCGVTDIPFSESFENVSAIPDCWSQTQTVAGSGSGTDYADNCWIINTYSYNAHSGTKSLQLQDTKNGTHTILVSPHFATEVEGGLTLSFWMYRTTGTTKADEGVKVWVNNQPNLNGATALMHVTRCGGVAADALKVAPITTAGWYQYEKVLPIAGDVYVIFEGISEYGSSSYLDDIEVSATPTCLKPTDLHLASFDAESATLAWTAGGSETNWELTYKLGTNDAVTVPVNGTPEYIIEGLTPATSYTLSNLSLCAVCSVTDSSKVASFGNISFKTPCMAVTTYETDFEDETSSSGNMPECWTKVYSTSSSLPYVYDYGYYANSGTKSLYAYGSAPSYGSSGSPFSAVVALPQISGNVADYRLIFMAKESSSRSSQLAIGVLDDISDTTSFTVVDTITLTSSYASYTVNFASYTGAGKYVAIKYLGVLTYIYIDDVVLEPVPTCEKPGAISAAASYDHVMLQWTAGGDETKWQLAYQLGEEAVQTVIVENEPKYTISALEASTNYTISNISVKAICAVGDTSYARVLNTLNILTKCGPQTLPINETFEYIESGIPECWDNSLTTVTDASYNWNYYHITNDDINCLRFNSYNAREGQYGVLKSPIFTVPTDRAVELTFQYKNPAGGDFSVYVSRDGGVTMEEEALLSGLTGQSAWKEMSVSFDAAATDKLVICFKAISNYGNGDAYIYLDDVSIKAPLCSKPYGAKVVAVTDNSVDLGWADSYAASYKALLFSSEPTTISEGAALSVKTVESNAASFDGLEANTQYYLYIQGICDAENSEYSKVFAFRTACAAEELPYVEDFEDAGAVLCWKAIGEAATVQSTTVAFGGSGKALALTSDSVNVMLVSPKFNVESLASYNVNLAAYSNAPDTLAIGVIVDINHPADTYIDLGIIGLATAKQWNEYSFSFAALSEEGYEDYANAQYIAISVPANSSVIIDAVEVVLPAQCAKPTAITIETIGGNVSIDWTSEAASHEVIITSADTVAFSGVVSKPFIPEGFVPNSDYQIKVRAICPVEGEDDPIYSDWSAVVAFKTPCPPSSLPFSEDFTAWSAALANYNTRPSSAILPDCWNADESADAFVYVSSNSTYTEDGKGLLFVGRQGGSADSIYVYLPGIASTNDVVFTADYKQESSYGQFIIGYVTSAGNAHTFVPVKTLNGVSSFTSTDEVILPSLNGYVYPVIKFKTSPYYYAGMDNIQITEAPSCTKPSGLTSGNVTTNSAKLSWTANAGENQWQLIYKLSSKSVADTLLVEGTPEYIIPNLTAATSYTLSGIKLRAICSETDSSEVASFSNIYFTTECGQIETPWFENFDNSPSGRCWSLPSGVTMTTSSSYANSGTGILRFATKDTCVVVLPNFGALNGKRFTFTYRAEGTGTNTTMGFIKVGYVTNPLDTSTFVALADYNEHVFEHTPGMVIFGSAVPAGAQPAIQYYGATGSNWYLFMDDFVIEEVPDCEAPTALNLVAATDASLQIAIVDDADATAWEYALNSVDGEIHALDNRTFMIEELDAQTEYTVYVRRVCGENASSRWISANFKTACGSQAIPWSENFDDEPSSDCWILPAGVTMTTSSSYANSGEGVLKFATSSTCVVVLPNFGDLDGKRFTFTYRAEGNGSTTTMGFIKVGYVTNPLDTSTFVALADYNEHVFEHTPGMVIFGSAVPAGAQPAIQYYGATSSSWYLFMDDFVIEEVPDCEAPTALNLVAATDASLQIAIVDDADATAWEYVLNSVDGEIHALDNRTFMIEELDAQTEYTVYVRRVCGENASSRWISANFKTACDWSELPFSESFEGLSSGEIPECWDNSQYTCAASYRWQYNSSYYSGHNGSDKAIVFNAYNASEGTTSTLLTPHINNGEVTNLKLSFYMKNGDEAALDVKISLDGGVTYPLTYLTAETGSADWQLFGYTFEADPNSDIVVSFTATSDYGSDRMYLDEVVVEEAPSCEKPQGLSVVEISASQVTVQIADTASTHTAWQVIAVPQGNTFNEEDAQDAPAKLAVFTLASPLHSGDIVDIYVRTACGDEDGNSQWFGPVRAKYVDYSTMVPEGISIVSTSAYTWDIVTDNGQNKLQSTNSGVVSACDMTLTFTVAEGAMSTLSFDYLVSASESSPTNGALYVYDNVESPSTANYTKAFYGGTYSNGYTSTGTATMQFTEGTHTLLFRYNKTSAYSYGQDLAQVWNFTLSEQTFFAPTDLHISRISGESVTLAWSPCGDATGYQINIKSSRLDSVLTTTENSVTIEGLSALTVYTAAIRSCNLTDTTAYSAIVRFTTPCASVDLPFSESFEGLSSGEIPECWDNSQYTCNASYRWQYNSSYYSGHDGSDKAIIFNAYSASEGTTSTLLTPHINNGEVTNLKLSFYMKNGDETTLDVKISLDGGATYSLVAFNAEAGSSSWNKYTYAFEAVANSDIVVSFTATSDYGSYRMYLDEVVLEEAPACETPATVSVVSAEGSTIQLAITDADTEHNAWDAVVVLKDTAIDEDNIVNADSKLVNIMLDSALVSGTTYDIYVRTNCGEESYSAWVGPVSYKYVDFSTIANGASIVSSGAYPWDVIADNGVSKAVSTNDGVSYSASDMSTTIVVGEGQKATVSFDYWANGSSSYGYLAMFIDTIPTTVSSSAYDPAFGRKYGDYDYEIDDEDNYHYTYVGEGGSYTFTLGEGMHTVLWRYYISSNPSSSYYYNDTYDFVDGRNAKVWNVNVTMTDKWAPDDLELVEVGLDTAAITWKQCKNVVSSEVKIGETIYTSDNNAIVLRDLTPNTEYKVVVRSLFAEGEPTAWSDTLTFRTECGLLNLPYVENFNGYVGVATGSSLSSNDLVVLPACWTFVNNQAESGSSTYPQAFISSNSGYNVTGNALFFKSKSREAIYALLPSLALEEGDNVNISFVYRNEGTSNSNGTLSIGYLSADNAVFRPIRTLERVTTMTPIRLEEVIYYADSLLTFRYVGGTSDNYYASIDDIHISKLAYAEPYTDITCSTQDYEGYGFTLAQEDMHVGLNRLVRIEESENENAVDTARVLELTVVESSITELTDTACAGSGYYKNGFNINNVRSGVRYELDLQNVAGCDSIVYLTLYVPETNYTAAATICEGDTYEFGTQTLSTSGEYQETFTSIECGCDSIVTLTLTVLPAQVTLNETICEGDSIFFDGVYRKESDAYVAELTNILGCDSTVTLNLTVLEKTNEARQGVFCSGSVYNDNDFVDLDSAGVYTLVLTNAANCDSIITLTLVEHEPEAVSVSATIVQGEAYVFGNNTYTEEGVYVETFVDQYGCDSVVTLTLTVSTDLEEVLSNEEIKAAEKFMHNGILYIRANDIIYDAQGKRVIVRKED